MEKEGESVYYLLNKGAFSVKKKKKKLWELCEYPTTLTLPFDRYSVSMYFFVVRWQME